MSEPLETWIDAAIGETREALVREGKPIALRIARASDEGRRARWGELYCARVREIDRRRRGAFLDLGLRDQQGFLPLGDDGRVRMRNGARGSARRPGRDRRRHARGRARQEPGRRSHETGHDGEAPHRIARHDVDEELVLAKPRRCRTSAPSSMRRSKMRSRAPTPIPGGGVLTIEPTAALVAIDVDAGGRAGQRRSGTLCARSQHRRRA